jgi:hypothetical protein
MNMNELKRSLLKEAQCNPDGVSIGVLSQEYGRAATHAALWEMRRDRQIRLVACGESILSRAQDDGCETEDYLQGDNETFVLAMTR